MKMQQKIFELEKENEELRTELSALRQEISRLACQLNQVATEEQFSNSEFLKIIAGYRKDATY